MKKIIVRLVVIALIVLAALSVRNLLFAAPQVITQPDSLTITSAACYGGILEVGDIGCLTHYDIAYASLPTELASETFLNNFISSSSTSILRSTNPFVFVNSGYGNGVTNIYFTATEVAELGVTWAASHPMQMAGNPSAFPSVPSINTSITWIAQEDAGDLFGAAVTTLGNTLEIKTEWAGVDLVTVSGEGNTILTAQGEDYFVNVIPNLRAIAPEIFDSSILTPQFQEREFTGSYADDLETQFDDTALSSTFDELAGFTAAPEIMVRTVFALIITLGVWGGTTAFMKDTPNGPAIATMTVPIMIASATLLGWIALQAAGVIGFICLFVIGLYFVRR